MRAVLLAQADDFCTLAKGNALALLEGSDVPRGCCLKVISDQLSLLVNLTGIIDIDQEIQRLSKEKERLGPAIETYRRKVDAPGYESKVPEAVRATNAEKLLSLEAELEATVQAIQSFELMR